MSGKLISSVKSFYKRSIEKRDLTLAPYNNSKYIVPMILLLSLATIGWMTSTIGTCYELIRIDSDPYKTVHDCAICNDGWVSHSFGPGTCSWHDGVNYYKYKEIRSGFHLADLDTYYAIILICLIIIIIPSGFSKVYRITAFSFQLTGLRVLSYIIGLPFVMSYSLYTHRVKKTAVQK